MNFCRKIYVSGLLFGAGITSVQAAVEFVGFNARGRLSTTQQIEYAHHLLSQLTPAARVKTMIRVNGGTVAQIDRPSDWETSQIQAWVNLQRKFKFGLVYDINGNDTPASQAAFIQKWIDQGAKFEFIEMMNEYYLPKFRNGKTSLPEVTRKITPEYYVNEMLPAFFKELRRFKLRFFVIGAPKKTNNRKKDIAALKEWNQIVIEGMKKIKDPWGITVHLYKRDIDSFDYVQIDELRAMLPPKTPIAVTEAGLLTGHITSYEQAGELTVKHYEQISARLTKGDYLFDQVLFNHPKDRRFMSATFHTFQKQGGVTPKGKALVNFFNTLMK